MGSNSSSLSKGNFDVHVTPVGVKVSATGLEIATRIDKGEEPCPDCQKSGGLKYTRKDDVYNFKCSHCNLDQNRNSKNTVKNAEMKQKDKVNAVRVGKAEEAENVDKSSNLRAAVAKRIQDMVDDAIDGKMDGKVSIIYEYLDDLKWLPVKGNGEFLRRIKHWRLIIQLGSNVLTLEFIENSISSSQGVLLVGPYGQGASNNATPYLVGYLKGLSTEMLSKWIQEHSEIWKEYNTLTNNCQHFVHEFPVYFEEAGYLARTGHLAAVSKKHKQPPPHQQEQEEQRQNQ
ncbi:hypothetical protein BGZ90_002858 [Linnemannia elongata]|nr:hypothetical protein BGZ90_002858 [Linnemannia elongata]